MYLLSRTTFHRIPLHPPVQPQVEKTEDLREQSKQKAEVVTTQASAVMNVAKGIAEAANQQVDALARAKDMLPSAAAATEEALAALR